MIHFASIRDRPCRVPLVGALGDPEVSSRLWDRALSQCVRFLLRDVLRGELESYRSRYRTGIEKIDSVFQQTLQMCDAYLWFAHAIRRTEGATAAEHVSEHVDEMCGEEATELEAADSRISLEEELIKDMRAAFETRVSFLTDDDLISILI